VKARWLEGVFCVWDCGGWCFEGVGWGGVGGRVVVDGQTFEGGIG